VTGAVAASSRTQRRARFRPLLVLLACVVCLPAALFAGPDGRADVPMLVAMGLLCVGAVVGRIAGGGADPSRREAIGVTIISATAATLLVLAARSALAGPVWLGVIAAASVSMATIRRPSTRTAVQGLLVVGTGIILASERPDLATASGVVAVLGPLALLVTITALASALAGDLERARRRELATRRAAERRAELLEAVRQLTAAGRGEGVDVTVEALKELGFPVAAVLLLDADRLEPRRVDGLEPRADFGEGVSGHALAAGRTVVSPDYRNDELRLPGLDLGAVVATPIVADGRALGVLSVGLHDPGAPPMGDVEVVETLAAHLGGALSRQRVVDNQNVLLTRLRDLDVLRGSFVDRVSEDLRDPLTVVRGVAQTLAAHGERLPDDHRTELLARLTAQAGDLSGTLEALLDFSRVQVGRGDPDPRPVDLLELLGPPLSGTGIEVHLTGRPVVVVDRELLQRAIELLRRGAIDLEPGIEVAVSDRAVTVDVRMRELDALQGGFARTLAEQLIVAGGARAEQMPNGLRLVMPTVSEPARAR
jgi:signal transduction histidine kinase